MPEFDSYCDFCLARDEDDLDRTYHDTQYGFPLHDDNELFGRLLLEINQAGLSWRTILAKQDNFRRAYSDFNIDTVAGYGEKDRERLLNDAGIIRNRLKIDAAIHNARVILDLRKEFDSFEGWLDAHHPLSREEWTAFFKNHFKFVGGRNSRRIPHVRRIP